MMKAKNKKIDATFTVEPGRGAPAIVFHARGGSGARALNTEYAAGLAVLVERLRGLGKIRRVEVASRTAMKAPAARRVIVTGATLAEIEDHDAARLAIMKAAAAWGRADGAKGSGNGTKRIRFVMEWGYSFGTCVRSHEESARWEMITAKLRG